MTAEQLEELLGKVTPDWCVYSELDVGLMPSLFAGQIGVTGFGPLEPLQGYDLMLAALAPSLARRVLAAEKLVEAIYDDASDQWWTNVHKAATAYHEASK